MSEEGIPSGNMVVLPFRNVEVPHRSMMTPKIITIAPVYVNRARTIVIRSRMKFNATDNIRRKRKGLEFGLSTISHPAFLVLRFIIL
jgi:hypothetical protein